MSRRLELPVGPELAGIRVDTLLKRRLGLSGTVVRRIKWLPDGILVDGRRVNTRYVPRVGEVLSVRLSEPELKEFDLACSRIPLMGHRADPFTESQIDK